MIHKRILSLFGNITRLTENAIEYKLAKRQLEIKTFKSHSWFIQGRRRVFRSCPAEEAIKCRRHARGRARERGTNPPLLRGVLGAFPRFFKKILSASMCVFNGIFMRLGPDFSRFGHKDISCRVKNLMLDKIVFRQSHVWFFYFFLQHVFLTF